MEEYMKAMNEKMGGSNDPNNMPELGDACIAAPFTYKFTSIRSVKKLI
jgi:hypothetical protein